MRSTFPPLLVPQLEMRMSSTHTGEETHGNRYYYFLFFKRATNLQIRLGLSDCNYKINLKIDGPITQYFGAGTFLCN